jgi:hypothetical protein
LLKFSRFFGRLNLVRILLESGLSRLDSVTIVLGVGITKVLKLQF